MTRKDIDELIQNKKGRGYEIQILARALSWLYATYNNDLTLVRYKADDDGTLTLDENAKPVCEDIPDNELDSDDRARREGYNMAIEDLCKLIAKI